MGNTTCSTGATVTTPLSEVAAEAWLPLTCFKHGPPGRLGLEVELLPLPRGGTARCPALDELHRALGRLSLLGALTIEPGGQVELSSRPCDDLPSVLRDVATDLRLMRSCAAGLGWRLTGHGLHPAVPPRRILDLPRYAAMEAYLDGWGAVEGVGPAGRLMMSSTASVQVNVEAATGPADSADQDRLAERWELLHAVGPPLVAAFANSSWHRGRPTGWKSARQAVWLALDPGRTRAPRPLPGEGLGEAWSRWCLDAPVMLVRRADGPWTAPRGLTFRQWIRAGRRAVPDRPPPDLDDLAYHLTTLFPPVRARGHLEVRYLDAQPGPWWVVPAAVLTGLLDHPRTADLARDVCAPVRERWSDAARSGLEDRELARAALRLFELALSGLAGLPGTTAAVLAVEAFADRWTARGRCPGDDVAAGPALDLSAGWSPRPAPPQSLAEVLP
jgi:glutamate--cysteine ligase